MINFAGRGLLLDIEGTTSSIRFVYDVLFPEARERVEAFLERRWSEPSVQAACRQIAADAGWADFDCDRIVAEVTARGIPLYQGSCSEVYLEKAFDATPWRPRERLHAARELGETSLMFLTHPTLTDDEVGRMCETVAEVLHEAAR